MKVLVADLEALTVDVKDTVEDMVEPKSISLPFVREESILKAIAKNVASVVETVEVVDPHTVVASTAKHDCDTVKAMVPKASKAEVWEFGWHFWSRALKGCSTKWSKMSGRSTKVEAQVWSIKLRSRIK